MKKIEEFINFLNSMKMTIVSGIFLIVSFILMMMKITVPVDPAWGSIIISGLPLLYSAVTRLVFQRWVSSALLIVVGMIASIMIKEIFAAGEIAFIMALGGILEDMTVEKAKKGISQLIKLVPEQARKITEINGEKKEEMIPIEKVSRNDILRVLPGEVVPVDGKIVHGASSIDQSVMTGESLPVDKEAGDSVFSGTLNCFGSIDIKAEKVGEDSSLQKLIRMVKNAENKKAPMQRIADKWASWIVPMAIGIAVLTFVFTKDITRAVTILVVFCPCALALATPTSIMAAIGQATKHGVLIKSGEALENMGKVDTITFDKTGTLTFGKLEVNSMLAADSDISGEELERLVCSAEKKSEHPLGKAIAEYGKAKNVAFAEPEEFKIVPGKGVFAKFGNDSIFCGNAVYMKESGVLLPENVEEKLDEFRNQGKISILAGKNDKFIGIITLSDMVRPNAKEVVEKLKNMGMEVVLLTGDHKKTADYFAEQVGIEKVYSELLPDEKVSHVERMMKEGRKVCMIGDGINDAPALKISDVGVSMGEMGTDITVEASDITLIGDNIDRVPYLKRLSNSAIKTIKFNISASMTINAVAVVLSVTGILNPTTGALVHNAGSVLVVLNAALLYDRKFF